MKNKGFTLVEILGVIVIVGLLLLLIVPNIVSKIGKG
ncbi:MAG: prepilin-type N-terminal cleavage/methylation domain-containing protein, partial [Bacilli bacterium]|nr:prepilin-type N-terminal cleavage/methylation domain-containing protein [Bacilli bacterium]MBR3199612.1 prepilin-type N-terminal cleavage/methylation domain-containing protein [Bacilli bacterium]